MAGKQGIDPQEDKQEEDSFNHLKDGNNEKILILMKENLELTKEVKAMVYHINRYVAWQRIFGILKVLIVLIPITLGVIYLPPMIKELYQQIIPILQTNIN